MGKNIENVQNMDQFSNILEKAGNKLVVVDFTATWCGPCRMIAPFYEEQSQKPENANIVFLKVDVDEAEDVGSHCNIISMPTFQFYMNGQMVDEFSGASENKLTEYLEKYRT